jgi:hypothetical protein
VGVSCYVPLSQAPHDAAPQGPGSHGARPVSKSPQVVRRGPFEVARWQSLARLWSWEKVQYDSLLSLALFMWVAPPL